MISHSFFFLFVYFCTYSRCSDQSREKTCVKSETPSQEIDPLYRYLDNDAFDVAHLDEPYLHIYETFIRKVFGYSFSQKKEYRAIFAFVAHSLNLDEDQPRILQLLHFNDPVDKNDPYVAAQLFVKICESVKSSKVNSKGLSCRIIRGKLKKSFEELVDNWAWVIVKLNENEYFVDPSPSTAINFEAEKMDDGKILDRYFLQVPDVFIYSHFPDDPNDQLLTEGDRWTLSEFEKAPIAYPGIRKIEMFAPDAGVIHVDESSEYKAKMSVQLSYSTVVKVEIRDRENNELVSAQLSQIQEDKTKFLHEIVTSFPPPIPKLSQSNQKEYELLVFVDAKDPVLKYKIVVVAPQDQNVDSIEYGYPTKHEGSSRFAKFSPTNGYISLINTNYQEFEFELVEEETIQVEVVTKDEKEKLEEYYYRVHNEGKEAIVKVSFPEQREYLVYVYLRDRASKTKYFRVLEFNVRNLAPLSIPVATYPSLLDHGDNVVDVDHGIMKFIRTKEQKHHSVTLDVNKEEIQLLARIRDSNGGSITAENRAFFNYDHEAKKWNLLLSFPNSGSDNFYEVVVYAGEPKQPLSPKLKFKVIVENKDDNLVEFPVTYFPFHETKTELIQPIYNLLSHEDHRLQIRNYEFTKNGQKILIFQDLTRTRTCYQESSGSEDESDYGMFEVDVEYVKCKSGFYVGVMGDDDVVKYLMEFKYE